MNNIILNSKVNKDKYTEYICEKFDLQNREENVTIIPSLNFDDLLKFDWNIGLICGNSGSGKSTVLKTLGDIKEASYDYNKSIVSQFEHLSEEEVVDLLQSLSLSSVPVWLNKPNELSNGERARLDICYHIANAKDGDIILIDEFSSTVNRSSAKSMSYALQRYVRKKNIKIILASCHFDIIEWLNPDWIFNLNKQKEDGCEIERLIYSDNVEYNSYQIINDINVLSEKYDI